MLKRLLSLVLLAAVGLPIVAPALALAQDPDAGLPVCCRRHGRHHCTMAMDRMRQATRQDTQPQIGAVCPYYPLHNVAPVTSTHLLVFHGAHRTVKFSAAPAPAARADEGRRISRERSRYKRGPPVPVLDLA